MTQNKSLNCNQDTEIYSRVTGFFRPVRQWNRDKQEEFKQRKTYNMSFDILFNNQIKSDLVFYEPNADQGTLA